MCQLDRPYFFKNAKHIFFISLIWLWLYKPFSHDSLSNVDRNNWRFGSCCMWWLNGIESIWHNSQLHRKWQDSSNNLERTSFWLYLKEKDEEKMNVYFKMFVNIETLLSDFTRSLNIIRTLAHLSQLVE